MFRVESKHGLGVLVSVGKTRDCLPGRRASSLVRVCKQMESISLWTDFALGRRFRDQLMQLTVRCQDKQSVVAVSPLCAMYRHEDYV